MCLGVVIVIMIYGMSSTSALENNSLPVCFHNCKDFFLYMYVLGQIFEFSNTLHIFPSLQKALNFLKCSSKKVRGELKPFLLQIVFIK